MNKCPVIRTGFVICPTLSGASTPILTPFPRPLSATVRELAREGILPKGAGGVRAAGGRARGGGRGGGGAARERGREHQLSRERRG
eukprot:7009770-Pyramimonas_sp.AAC.1